jgi:hypothetical protein
MLHSVHGVLACTGALVLGGSRVETVSERKLDSLVVNYVRLPDNMVATVNHGIVVGQIEKNATIESEYKPAVKE